MHGVIDTDRFSTLLREKSVDRVNRKLLIARLEGSDQEADLSAPANCGGLGRIRHFSRKTSKGWPPNPLPIDPASRALNIAASDTLRAQVFQNASCNWRCWYCYVPFPLLNADSSRASWQSASELVDLYVGSYDCPCVIDLTGGQPDLVPEWVPWMMDELQRRGLHEKVYLWSDDNLSNDYFWRYLSEAQQKLISNYKNYGKVLCFKGFDNASFAFNTGAEGQLFSRQFDICDRYLETQIDIYAYANFTTPDRTDIARNMCKFVDRLQTLHPNLPLRLVPLEIQRFTPALPRIQLDHQNSIINQSFAVHAWRSELSRRFSTAELSSNVCDISLRR